MRGGPRLVVRARRLQGAAVVALRAWVRGGARAETRPGTALITGRLLAEGTWRRDFRAISEQAEARGAALHGFGGYETHGVSCDALAQDWELAVDWVAELLLESAFGEERCAWLRRQAQGELESLADQADVLAGWGFLDQLYAPNPLSRPLQGDAENLVRLSAEECADYHRRGLESGVLVTVAGAIDEEAITARIYERFAALAGERVAALPPPAPDAASPERRQVLTGAADQAHLYLGQLTARRTDPDFPALELLSVVLGAGSGLAGRIPTRIRERDGLAYTAVGSAAAGAGIDPGRLVIYVATAPDTLERAEQAAREELARLLADGLTDAEVDEARSYLLGREPFRREAARQWADLLAESEIYGQPLEDPEWTSARYRALDRATVEAAARRRLDLEKLKVTVGLPGRRDEDSNP
jgi:zinc protease